MKDYNFNNVKEFLNAIYSDLTNTSLQDMTLDDLKELIYQFKVFDLGTDKLDQLVVFVENEALFGKTDIHAEVKKIVGKVLQLINVPDFNVKKQMYLAVCQDAYEGECKNFKALHSQIKCLDPDGSKNLMNKFNEFLPGAEKVLKTLKKLFD